MEDRRNTEEKFVEAIEEIMLCDVCYINEEPINEDTRKRCIAEAVSRVYEKI